MGGIAHVKSEHELLVIALMLPVYSGILDTFDFKPLKIHSAIVDASFNPNTDSEVDSSIDDNPEE